MRALVVYAQDADAAKNGLAACASLMADYDQCMSKVPPRKLIRVRLRISCCVSSTAVALRLDTATRPVICEGLAPLSV